MLVYEFVMQFAIPALLVFLVVLYSMKSRLFPKLAVDFYFVNFGIVLIDVLGGWKGNQTNAMVYEIAGCLVGVCGWVPYFLKSKRVKEIFIK